MGNCFFNFPPNRFPTLSCLARNHNKMIRSARPGRGCWDPFGPREHHLCEMDARTETPLASNTIDVYDIFASNSLESIFGKTTLALGTNYLLDKPPALIHNGFTAVTCPTAYDLLGRYLYGRLIQTL